MVLKREPSCICLFNEYLYHGIAGRWRECAVGSAEWVLWGHGGGRGVSSGCLAQCRWWWWQLTSMGPYSFTHGSPFFPCKCKLNTWVQSFDFHIIPQEILKFYCDFWCNRMSWPFKLSLWLLGRINKHFFNFSQHWKLCSLWCLPLLRTQSIKKWTVLNYWTTITASTPASTSLRLTST